MQPTLRHATSSAVTGDPLTGRASAFQGVKDTGWTCCAQSRTFLRGASSWGGILGCSTTGARYHTPSAKAPSHMTLLTPVCTQDPSRHRPDLLLHAGEAHQPVRVREGRTEVDQQQLALREDVAV